MFSWSVLLPGLHYGDKADSLLFSYLGLGLDKVNVPDTFTYDQQMQLVLRVLLYLYVAEHRWHE